MIRRRIKDGFQSITVRRKYKTVGQLLKKRTLMDAKPKTKHLLERWILIKTGHFLKLNLRFFHVSQGLQKFMVSLSLETRWTLT